MKNLYNSASATSEIEAKFIFQENAGDNIEQGKDVQSGDTELQTEENDAFATIDQASMAELESIVKNNPHLKDNPNVIDNVMEGTFSTDEAQTLKVAEDWLSGGKAEQLARDFAIKTAKEWYTPNATESLEQSVDALIKTTIVAARVAPVTDANNNSIKLNNQTLYQPSYEFRFISADGGGEHSAAEDDSKHYNAFDK